jgi:ABC-type maltose transport system permease subunit
MAASVVMTVPIAFLFFYFQKLFVCGLDGRRDQGMTNSQTD